ncbi:MAG: prepilin-type N-terminal cleavage/methylation domain-containing protein [Aquificaceae bacterium]
MHTKLSKKGFTLVELLVAMVIILFLGIGLAKGVLELIKLDMRIKARQTAQQVVESWASYIQALPFNSWVINPNLLYYSSDHLFNRSLCDQNRRLWSSWNNPPNPPPPPKCCKDPNDPNCTSCNSPDCILCTNYPDYDKCISNCTYCSFMAPDVEVSITYPYDNDRDGILDIYDPYTGDNNCRKGEDEPACKDENGRYRDEYMKYRYPTWYLTEHLRLAPDQGSDNCACRLGNRQENIPLKCTYQVGKSGGVSWDPAPGNKVYVGITVINYAHLQNPTAIVGKAIGIVAWYFDPIDKKYRAYTKVVFK